MGWALALELAPAALFGGAVAFASAGWLGEPALGLVPAALGAAAFAAAWAALRRFGAAPDRLPLRAFEPGALDAALAESPDEPRLAPPVDQECAEDEVGELLLDDPLVIAPDSRVVRLFRADAGSAPTAGELHARIETHLRSAVRPIPTPPDAADALHEALAELRRSLR